jgi:4-cresol dehydrogenase (hydroxylating)
MLLSTALEAWKELLGAENVILDPRRLGEAETATFATDQRIPAILRPANRAEIQDCLRIANRAGIAVYPVSSGRNWGYGSRVPVRDGCALLDLGRLDRIVDFDDRLGYVTVEPGVTQAQLYEFLQQQGGRWWMDATGSSPHTSLIGNTVERGFGHTPYGDHFAHVAALEVVLPGGACIHTGFGRFPGAQAAPVYRWGVGPSLDGLFSQSNFGVVTQMTLWLMPAPEYFQAFFFGAEQPEALGSIVDALRPLRQNGTLKSAIHLGNGYKVLSSLRQYPWQEMAGCTPLSEAVLADFGRAWDFGAWSGSGGLYGTRAQVAEARRLLRAALAGRVKSLKFVDDRAIALGERFSGLYQRLTGTNLTELLKLLKPVYNLMKGIPSDAALASTYWRKTGPVPAEMHPDRDGCGLLWCAPVVPLDGKHALTVDRIVRESFAAHPFEPMISMTLMSERAISAIITIAYDRAVPGEDERALACYRHLSGNLAAAGYHPYRLGIQAQPLAGSEPEYEQLVAALKGTLDPNHILAPGRYDGSNREPVSGVSEVS